jgi:hypothetical protein
VSRAAAIVAGLLLLPLPVLAADAAVTPGPGVSQQPGMIIKGDQEAPLVLFIVPWQEPKPPAAPAVLQQSLLPPVLDDNRSLVDNPVNRSAGQPETAPSPP